jgi:hypothetical protein
MRKSGRLVCFEVLFPAEVPVKWNTGLNLPRSGTTGVWGLAPRNILKEMITPGIYSTTPVKLNKGKDIDQLLVKSRWFNQGLGCGYARDRTGRPIYM